MEIYERKRKDGKVTYYLHYYQDRRLVRERMAGISDLKRRNSTVPSGN